MTDPADSGGTDGRTDGGDDVVDLGDLSDLGDGEMRCFEEVGRHGIVVCRAGGQLYAVEDNCSHADTPLSEGRFRGHTLTCPLHGAQFDVRDGSHSGPPAWEGVLCYRVTESETGVTVTLSSGAPDDVGDGDGYGEFGGMFRTR